MYKEPKNWLVRTRVGEILGPYTQRELLDELQRKTFSATDEIAPSLGFWISAQTLLNRDSDEFTRTSTRNTSITRSTEANLAMASQVQPAPQPQPVVRLEADPSLNADFLQRPPTEPPLRRIPQAASAPRANTKWLPLVAGAMIVMGLWGLAGHLKPSANNDRAETRVAPEPAASSTIGESRFVRDMYAMIHAGQTATALSRLATYHEKMASPNELDYLIPFAALLITEQVSPARAKKLLEKVLSAPNASDELKAKAHHWLGYLALSQDEKDWGESHFLDSLQLNKKDPAARFNLGRAFMKQEKYRQALDYLTVAELDLPNLWLIHIYKGRAKTALGLVDEAASDFKKAVNLAKDRWISYLYHALFLIKREDQDGARRMMRTMLTRDPNYELQNPPPFGFYQEKINYAEYLNSFNHVMQGTSGEERELGRLYLSYLMNGSASDEAKRIEAVADRGGLMAKVFALKVVLDRESSSEEIKKALTRLPPHLSDFGYYAYVLRGEARMRSGDMEGAQADFSLSLQLEPQSAISHFAYATLLKRTGRDGQAREKIQALLSYHPDYIPAIVFSQNF
jgi:tetratricopeptide (TPR) repeat protein